MRGVLLRVRRWRVLKTEYFAIVPKPYTSFRIGRMAFDAYIVTPWFILARHTFVL